MRPPPPSSPLFPYTTLFRSGDLLHRTGRDHRRSAHRSDRRDDARERDREAPPGGDAMSARLDVDRKSTRLNSSHANMSYAVFRLKKKKDTSLKPPRGTSSGA